MNHLHLARERRSATLALPAPDDYAGAMDDGGWDKSAAAWIADMARGGDKSRRYVLDGPMVAEALASGSDDMLDVGCGEGRFCRMMSDRGLACTGLDPTAALLDEARRQDPSGSYILGHAESLPFEAEGFGLVVSYLTLIDIPDAATALGEMARVLRPGGRLVIANLNAVCTAGQIKNGGWKRDASGAVTLTLDRYLEEHAHWAEWRGIRIRNWHRPMAFYMRHLLNAGLRLVHFDEPPWTGSEKAARYNRAPYFLVMSWEKPAA